MQNTLRCVRKCGYIRYKYVKGACKQALKLCFIHIGINLFVDTVIIVYENPQTPDWRLAVVLLDI